MFVADYFVFNSHVEYNVLKAIRFFSLTVITTEQFKNLPLGFFYDVYSEMSLLQSLENFSVKTLLDVDGLFAKGMLFTKTGNDFTEIDCISEKPLMPIKENFYRRVYKNFSKVGFRRYDAALIVERPPIDFMSAFVFLEKKTQPDYLDAFDYVLGSSSFYKCNMFVTRRDVFDAYCKWLFSFIIDATREVLRMTNPQRTMGFFCECMLSVWLAKNHLRIKELPIMEVKNI